MADLESRRQLLEMGEAGAPLADVPAELQNQLDYCTAKDFVKIRGAQQIGWTAYKITHKQATDLQPGDVLQLKKDDTRTYTVKTVQLVPDNRYPHTVELTGTGLPLTYSYKDEVIVFDGPPPRPVFSPPALILTPHKGKAALAKLRIAKQPKAPAKQAQGSGARTAPARQEAEGIGTPTNPGDEGVEAADEEEEPSDRQCLILETMLTHEIISERRRETRAAVVKLINRKHKPQTYNRDFAALVKLGYLRSREGPEGGVWINPHRKADVERIISPD